MCIITVVLVAAFSSSSNGKWPKESHLAHDALPPLRLLNGTPDPMYVPRVTLQHHISRELYVIGNVADDNMAGSSC